MTDREKLRTVMEVCAEVLGERLPDMMDFNETIEAITCAGKRYHFDKEGRVNRVTVGGRTYNERGEDKTSQNHHKVQYAKNSQV